MRPLYLILLFLWFIASYFLCKNCCNNTVATGAEAATSAVGAAAVDGECITDIEFEDGDFIASSSENFRFNMSEESQLAPSEDFLNIITQVADHLAENPDRFMQLTGYYVDGEENASDYDNLGVARAKSVREYLKDTGISGTQLTTNSEMLESACTKDGVLLKGIGAKFAQIKQ